MVKKKKSQKRVKLDQQRAYSPTDNALAPNQRPPKFGGIDPNTGRMPFAPSPFPSGAGAGLEPTEGNDELGFASGVRSSITPVGNSGTQIFGGYFSEDYLHELRGRAGARKWDEMRRSEAQVAMLLNAIINPIKAGNWSTEAYDESDPECVKDAELIDHCLFNMIDFDTLKHEALTCLPFGFSLLEIVHLPVVGDPKFGDFNGLASLAFRSQKTIENWQLEAKTGKLQGVNQYTYSDLGGNQFIPGEFLLVFTISKEGDNYEGISVLRPMYGSYKRKELYLKLAAIGIERYAVGTPIGTIPKNKEKTQEYEEFKKTLQNYTSHESSYIIVPEGWDIEIQRGEFDAEKVKSLCVFENTEMANALVANFLALGLHGSGGALALGSNLQEFFTTGIQSYADLIAGVINKCLIPQLIKMNYGERKGYPKLKCTGISDKAGKELAETIKLLTDARAIDPDMPLKEFLRKQYKLPKPDPSTAVILPANPAGASANIPKSNDATIDPVTDKVIPARVQASEGTVQLADKKYVKNFDAQKSKLKFLMQSNLRDGYAALKELLRKKYKSLAASDKILAAKNLEMPGLQAYKKALKDQLGETALKALDAARKQVPSKKNIKLSAKDYDALPPSVRKLIDVQSSLIAETQAADIEKIVFFRFTNTAATEDDIDAILHDVDEAVEPTLDGATGEGMSIDAAAGNAVAQVSSASSLSFFFADGVLDDIESFTFTNEDPISEICQELEGTTFAPTDPDLDQYTPPLHHNCKSRLVPNLKGDDTNPEIDRGGVSLSKKALASRTLSEKRGAHKK